VFGSRHSVAGLCVVVALALPVATLAKTKPRSGPDAYREMIPTSTGGKAVGGSSGGASALPLAPKTAVTLGGAGRGGRTLRKVATSPRFGAPTEQLPESTAASIPRDSSVGAGLAAASRAVGSGDRDLIALVAALGATTLAVTTAAVVRARRSRR
jgi:hypothetical protein